MAHVKAPNEEYSGLSAGVFFYNGIGETEDPYLLSWFEVHGYIVEKNLPGKKTRKKAEPVVSDL